MVVPGSQDTVGKGNCAAALSTCLSGFCSLTNHFTNEREKLNSEKKTEVQRWPGQCGTRPPFSDRQQCEPLRVACPLATTGRDSQSAWITKSCLRTAPAYVAIQKLAQQLALWT